MNRILIAIAVAVLAVISGYAVVTNLGDGEGADSGVSGLDTTPPGSSDLALGHVEVVAEYGTEIVVKAVPADGASLYGWFFGDVMISDRMFEIFDVETIEGIEAVFTEGFTKSVEYTWEMPLFASDGSLSGMTRHEVVSISLWSGEYWSAVLDNGRLRHATYADPMPVFMLSDSDAVDQVVEYMEPLVEGMTNLQKATVLAYFVQDVIDYESDSSQYGVTEFWTTPDETLYTGRGDCEDTATLYVNIGARMGLNVGFVAFEDPRMGHMSAAVALDDGVTIFGDAVFEVDGVRYAYVETAIDNTHSDVGQLSSAYRITDGNWTSVMYDSEIGEYIGDSTVPIGTGTVTGAPMIYGKTIPKT